MADDPRAEWYPDKCPNCGQPRVRPMSSVAHHPGTAPLLHYRCPGCMWSWRRIHASGGLLALGCHEPLTHPGQECSECGSFLPMRSQKGGSA